MAFKKTISGVKKAAKARKTAKARKRASIAAGLGSVVSPKQAGKLAFEASLGRTATRKAKQRKPASIPKTTTTAKSALPGRRPKARTAGGVSRRGPGKFGGSTKKTTAAPVTTPAKTKRKRGFGAAFRTRRT